MFVCAAVSVRFQHTVIVQPSGSETLADASGCSTDHESCEKIQW
jgi:hypothetical protein